MLLRSALALLAAAVLAGPAGAAPPPFKATLTASGHTVKVNAPWTYAVRVTDPKGRPVRASVHLQVLFGGMPVGQIGRHVVTGVWKETIRWPPASRGQPLVFQAVVTVKRAVRKLNYAISVQ